MKTQDAMFWQSHKHMMQENLLKALEIAQKNRSKAVEAWRQAGSDESRWHDFIGEADRLLDIAERNLIHL